MIPFFSLLAPLRIPQSDKISSCVKVGLDMELIKKNAHSSKMRQPCSCAQHTHDDALHVAFYTYYKSFKFQGKSTELQSPPTSFLVALTTCSPALNDFIAIDIYLTFFQGAREPTEISRHLYVYLSPWVADSRSPLALLPAAAWDGYTTPMGHGYQCPFIFKETEMEFLGKRWKNAILF